MEKLKELIKTYEILFDQSCKTNKTADHLRHIKDIRSVLVMMRAELDDREYTL